MRHPFAGIQNTIPEKQQSDGSSPVRIPRRSALGKMVFGAVVGVAALDSFSRFGVGAEGDKKSKEKGSGSGSGSDSFPRVPATTTPFGEEAGKVLSFAVPGLEDGVNPTGTVTDPHFEGGVTNLAFGQGGGEQGFQVNGAFGGISGHFGEGGVTAPGFAGAAGEGGVTTAPGGFVGGVGGVGGFAGGVGGVGGFAGGAGGAGGFFGGFESGGPPTTLNGEPGFGPLPIAVAPLKQDHSQKQLEALWKDLGSKDAYTSLQASAALYGSKHALVFLKKTLQDFSSKEINDKRVSQCIADLDHNEFAVREKADAELLAIGPRVQTMLSKACQNPVSLEQRVRLECLQETLKNDGRTLQALSALEVLVALNNKDAFQLLDQLAKGNGTDWLTLETKKAMKRPAKK